jgi:hypothetical protein
LGKKDNKTKDPFITNKIFRDTPKDYAWRRGKDFFVREIEPIVEVLQSKKLGESHETWLKNYLVIRLVSIMEDFFKTLVKGTVDRYNLQLSLLYEGEVSMRLGILDEMLKRRNNKLILTRGQIVANEFNFANYEVINTKFTALLNSKEKFGELGIDFFSAIKKLEWYDPLEIFKGAKPMNENWDNFEKIFFVTNEIVHHMIDVNLSRDEIISLCDNTLNVMDAASFICMLSKMNKIVKIMKSQKTKREEIKEAEEKSKQERRLTISKKN